MRLAHWTWYRLYLTGSNPLSCQVLYKNYWKNNLKKTFLLGMQAVKAKICKLLCLTFYAFQGVAWY